MNLHESYPVIPSLNSNMSDIRIWNFLMKIIVLNDTVYVEMSLCRKK